MRRYLLTLAVVLGAGGVAAAQDSAPNFTGVWTGTFRIVAVPRDGGEGQVQEVPVTYDLNHQDGRLLWGTVWSDPAKKRPIALAFSMDNGTIVGSDSIGLHRLTVVTMTRMEACFTDSGNEGPVLASCGLINKAP